MRSDYIALAVLCASALFAGNVMAVPLGAGFDVDLELTGTSDYRFQGISQTLGNPAIQSGATLSSPIGAYVGTWVSSVNYGAGVDSRLEQDYFAGWYIPISDDLSLDVGWLKYTYDKDSQLNQSVYYGIANYKGLELSYQYSDNLYGDQVTAYTYLSYEYPFDDTTRMNVRYGVMDYKDKVIVSANETARSTFHEWEARIEKDLWGVTWKASLVDTDMSKTECASLMGYDDLCSASVVATVSKHF